MAAALEIVAQEYTIPIPMYTEIKLWVAVAVVQVCAQRNRTRPANPPICQPANPATTIICFVVPEERDTHGQPRNHRQITRAPRFQMPLTNEARDQN